MRVARIVEVSGGRALVSFDGRVVPARSAMAGAPGDGLPWIGRAVLVALEDGDPDLPVIVGVVSDTLPGTTTLALDADRVALEGREELVLRCGEASLTLRADGQVLVKGQRITSRAEETHKIRGATVQIN